ncbi:MAG TPA: MauE/DoxX family redox-associated membrane protein [Flavobacteriales bacterium]|nr:MauE/DoxX family redox-associated membrane protein [Flavobacteriales bacterium]
MKFVAVLFNVIVGSVFILSAWLKTNPIDYFETKISFFGIEGVMGAVVARLIIAGELLIGLFLITQFTIGKLVYKTTIAVLSIFIIINLIDLIRFGNDTDCGCMGLTVQVSPLMSIAKNILLIGMTIFSMRFGTITWKLPVFATIAIALTPFSSVFMYKPVYVYENVKMPKKGTRPDFTIMDVHPGFKGKTYKSNAELSKGKKIVAFLSLTCPHCKMAAYKLNGFKALDPELPIYFILNGDSSNMDQFFKVTGKPVVDMAHFNGNSDYADMSGYELPAIFLLKDGVVELQWNNATLTKAGMMEWLEK